MQHCNTAAVAATAFCKLHLQQYTAVASAAESALLAFLQAMTSSTGQK
jgi:hypothetical protein